MPPHLHPRSRSTTSLFTGCLAVSFLVVGMPHILPCPVDRRQFSDSGTETGPKQQRRRRKSAVDASDEAKIASNGGSDDARTGRECPVPKPRGLLGQIMGFEDRGEGERVVVVRSLEEARMRRRREGDAS